MSHPSKIEVMIAARTAGFRVVLYFVATEDPSLNVDRVRQRAALQGHDVPEDRIRARYDRTLQLLPEAIAAAGQATLFDNTTVLLPIVRRSGETVQPSPPIPQWSRPALKEWLAI